MSDDYFHFKHGIFDEPWLQADKASTFGLLCWIASMGAVVVVHFDDLVEETKLHPRKLARLLRRLEDAGQISISGGGAVRTIILTSDMVRSSGEWVSGRAEWDWSYGGSKWRGAPLQAAIRRKVFERDGEVCAYCGTTKPPFHIDHIKSVADGGTDALGNLTVSCRKCNTSKGRKSIKEWRKS